MVIRTLFIIQSFSLCSGFSLIMQLSCRVALSIFFLLFFPSSASTKPVWASTDFTLHFLTYVGISARVLDQNVGFLQCLFKIFRESINYSISKLKKTLFPHKFLQITAFKVFFFKFIFSYKEMEVEIQMKNLLQQHMQQGQRFPAFSQEMGWEEAPCSRHLFGK